MWSSAEKKIGFFVGMTTPCFQTRNKVIKLGKKAEEHKEKKK